MDFNEYQKEAHKTAEYPDTAVIGDKFFHGDGPELILTPFLYASLGLAGEAGEVAEKVKKIIRNKKGLYTDEDVSDIRKELGDVLWYIAELCTVFDISMENCAKTNIEKLADRKERDVIKSEGDNR